MTLEEIKLRRLAGQHLLAPTDTQTVVKDLCGAVSEPCAPWSVHPLHRSQYRWSGQKLDEPWHYAPVLSRRSFVVSP